MYDQESKREREKGAASVYTHNTNIYVRQPYHGNYSFLIKYTMKWGESNSLLFGQQPHQSLIFLAYSRLCCSWAICSNVQCI